MAPHRKRPGANTGSTSLIRTIIAMAMTVLDYTSDIMKLKYVELVGNLVTHYSIGTVDLLHKASTVSNVRNGSI